ncbi:MAG: O-antigen ligase family protein [Chloroflexi bacterium]|nr:O-antigen ligase family protein [Chloroflexota bacterium]
MTGARLLTSLLFACLAVLTIYLVFIGGGWPGIYSVQLRTTSLYLIALSLGTWLVLATIRPSWRPGSALAPGLVLCLVALAVSTIFSRQPRLGYDYLAYSVLLVGMYLLLVRILGTTFLRDRFMVLVVVLASMIGVLYVLQVTGTWLEWWRLVGRVAAPPLRPEFAGLTFGNPSAVMTVSILLSLPAIAQIGFGSRARVAASVTILALALYCTLLSGSRAGWLGLGLGLAITAACWLAYPANRRSIRAFVRSRALLYSIAGGTVVAAVAAIAVIPGVLLRTGAGGEGLRLTFFRSAIRMFTESPIHGTGLGTWVAQRVAYTDDPAGDYYIPYSHNVFLQTLAESGVIGAAAGLVLLVLTARLISRSIRDGDGVTVRMAWAALLAVAYFGGHQLLDFYANMPAAMFAFAIPIAWLDAHQAQKPAKRGFALASARRPLGGFSALARVTGLAAVCLASVGWLAISEGTAAIHARAVDALNEGRDQDAVGPAVQAAEADPDMPPYQFTLGIAQARAGNDAAAAEAFAHAARLDDLPVTWLDLAAVQLHLGKNDEAAASLRRAARIGLGQATIALGIGELKEALGDTAGATEAFIIAVKEAPSAVGDPQLLAIVTPAIDPTAFVDRLLKEVRGTPTAVEIALEAGRQDQATALIDDLVPADRPLMRLVAAAWSGDDEAYANLRALAARQPLDANVVAWRARLEDRRGDHSGADADRRWFAIIYGSVAEFAYDLRISSVPSAPGERAGVVGPFYGHFTYRRPTAWNQVVDLLSHLTAK